MISRIYLTKIHTIYLCICSCFWPTQELEEEEEEVKKNDEITRKNIHLDGFFTCPMFFIYLCVCVYVMIVYCVASPFFETGDQAQ